MKNRLIAFLYTIVILLTCMVSYGQYQLIKTSTGSPYILSLISYNNKAYYPTVEGSDIKVYESDGTTSGTFVRKTIAHPNHYYLMCKLYANGNLLCLEILYANSPDGGTPNYELWVTDGVVFTLILSTVGNTPSCIISDKIVYYYSGNLLAYNFTSNTTNNLGNIAINSGGGAATDGNGNIFYATTSGNIYKYTYNSSSTTLLESNTYVNQLYFLNNELFYWKNSKLYKSNGQPNSGVLVSSYPPDVTWAHSLNSIYFYTNHPSMLDENYHSINEFKRLIRTDGTSAGTFIIGNYGDNFSGNAFGRVIGNFQNNYYFTAKTSGQNSSPELWKTDGSISGTIKVTNNTPDRSAIMNDRIYYIFQDKLWQTDGSTTSIMPNVSTNVLSGEMVNLNNSLIIHGNVDGVLGIWKYIEPLPCPNNLNLTDTISNGIAQYQTNNSTGYIMASNAITGNTTKVEYLAGKYILLTPGFNTSLGVSFTAQHGGCQ